MPPIPTFASIFQPIGTAQGTNYGPALLRALTKIIPPLQNSVLMIFSDGGDKVLDSV